MLYFNLQTILALVGIVALRSSIPEPEVSGNFLERLAATQELYATPILLAVVVSQYSCMLLPSWWLVKRWHTPNVKEYLRIRKVPLVEIVLAVLTTVAIIPTGTYLANLLTELLDIPDVLLEINAKLFTAHSFSEFLLLVFVIAITPAICEEVYFRGYVQRTFERTMNGKSVYIVGIIFGLFHMQPLGLITLAMLGLLFGFFYYRSKSLVPSMAAHFVNNFLAILVLYKAPELGDTNLATSNHIPLSWILVTLPIATALLFMYFKVTGRRATQSTI